MVMRVLVNGVDLTDVWTVKEWAGRLWVSLHPWAEESGVHVDVAPALRALTVCTEVECVPFPLNEPAPKAHWRDGWWVAWEALAEAMQGQWRWDGQNLLVTLPPTPLPRPLSLGERVPDLVFWQQGGLMRRLSDWAGRAFLLSLAPLCEWVQHERVLSVVLSLDFSSLPERTLADPFGVATEIFSGRKWVGISGNLRWQGCFVQWTEAFQWLEAQPKVMPENVPALAVVMTAWLETKRHPEKAGAWLTFAETQRCYCGLEAAMASYKRACELGSAWARWRWGVAQWLQGNREGARKIWQGGALPDEVQELWTTQAH